MIAIGGAMFYAGLLLYVVSTFFSCCEPTNRYLPWGMAAGFVMVLAGGIMIGELRL